MGEINSAERVNFLVPLFRISLLKVLRTQILRHSLAFNAFCVIEEYVSQAFNIFKNEIWGTKFLERNQFCKRAELIAPIFLYLNFNSFKDPDSSSFIRFQCILHDSAVLFSDF